MVSSNISAYIVPSSDPHLVRNIIIYKFFKMILLKILLTRQSLIDTRSKEIVSSLGCCSYIYVNTDIFFICFKSEYVAPRDRKRQWITGFTGSAGTAVITENKAAVWTDGRYFLQAEKQLDCNWILMRQGKLICLI